MRRAHTPVLGRTPSFWLLASILVLFLFAASAPSPLYVVYQARWGFSEITLTSVFAVYALALVLVLVVTGSVSDRVGRRSVLVLSLALEALSMLVFAEARSVAWLFAARTLQGAATGLGLGAISAGLIDLQPSRHPRLGGLLGAVAPVVGLAVGALGTGVLVQYGPAPTRLVYWLLLAAFTASAPVVVGFPETVKRDTSVLHALRPSLGVPRRLRSAFAASVPCLVATWALGGLVLALGPSLTAGVLGQANHAIAGLAIFVMTGVSAIASVALRNLPARLSTRGGLAALMVGVAVVLAGLHAVSLALFLVGAAIAGLGFGPAFSGAFRSLSSLAESHERAGLVSSILAVAYLAFSLPAIAAGVAVTQLGLRETADIYGAALIALSALALALSGRLQAAGGVAAEVDLAVISSEPGLEARAHRRPRVAGVRSKRRPLLRRGPAEAVDHGTDHRSLSPRPIPPTQQMEEP
jgi:Major Facilitator Superfamily